MAAAPERGRVCPDCGAPVLPANVQGRRVLLDPAPAPEAASGYLAYRAASGAWLARPITGGHRHPLERTYIPHTVTCTGGPRDRPQPV